MISMDELRALFTRMEKDESELGKPKPETLNELRASGLNTAKEWFRNEHRMEHRKSERQNCKDAD